MYQVLYRKHRPTSFADVYGQDAITAALRGEVRGGRLAHAYLFTGSRGTGKTTCARLLAKAVNCLAPVDGDPCGVCDSCKGLEAGTVLDVAEIDAASNNGVDSIRDLREEVGFTPVSAKYRVYIIDEVHMLSAGAFNALLKTLEEPPAHAIFILATTEVHKLPATILSRCQRFDFARISPGDIAARIAQIAEQEDFTVTPDGALLLGRLADGALRDALSLLDQCVSRSHAVDADVVEQAAGLVGREPLYALAGALSTGDRAALLRQVEQLHRQGRDMERLCGELLSFLRDLMILQHVGGAEAGELLTLSDAELARLRELAAACPPARVLFWMERLQSGADKLRFAGSGKRLEVELILLELAAGDAPSAPSQAAPQAALSQPVPQAAPQAAPVAAPTAVKSAAPEKAPPSAPTPAPVAADASTPAAMPAATADGETPFPRWNEILDVLARTCIPLYAVLKTSRALRRGDMLLIETADEMFRSLAAQDGNKAKLLDAVRTVTGDAVRIGVKRPQTASPPEDAAAAPEAPAGAFSQALKEWKTMGVVRDEANTNT